MVYVLHNKHRVCLGEMRWTEFVVAALVSLSLFASGWASDPLPTVLTVDSSVAFEQEVACRTPCEPRYAGCAASQCKRRVVDGLFSEDDVHLLRKIAEKGMRARDRVGGPTILDINTGFLRDSAGLENLFARPRGNPFSAQDFEHYGSVIRRLKAAVAETFGLQRLFFTAPTFVTRIDADREWAAREAHDEYWHTHADRNNTAHYHYSGLLYLSSYNEDFTGGRLEFFRGDGSDDEGSTAELIVEPRRGRVAIFTAGPENPHRVEKVSSGQRFVLSFWFTCDPQREFEIFLDGQAHVTFSKRVAKSLAAKSERA